LWRRRYIENALEQSKEKKCSVIRFEGMNADQYAPGILNIQKYRNNLTEESLSQIKRDLEVEHGIVVKLVRKPLSLRLCIPFYLTSDELNRVIGALNLSFAKYGV
jgi:hypothetical protein